MIVSVAVYCESAVQPRVSVGCPAFYRFPERCSDGLRQSARPLTVYRPLPDLLSGHGEPLPRLQPVWLSANSGHGARPWSGGAAGPCAERRFTADGGRRTRAGRRGVRAGRRVQYRRHRADRDEDRRRNAFTATPYESHPEPPYDRALIQVLPAPPGVAGGATSVRREGASRPAVGSGAQLRIGHLNVRSLTNKLDEVNLFLHDNDLDLLCLSETWLTPQILDSFLVFPGYGIVRRDRDGRRGGGVAIVHRVEMKLDRLTLPPDGPLETLWVSVSWRGGRPTTVGVIYRPPDSPVTPSLEHLHNQLRESAGAGRPVFLLGDTNFDVLNTTSSITRRYTDMLSELSMTQLVDGATHLHPTPTALDHAITNLQDPVPDVTICADVISDHQPIIVSARLGRRNAQWTTRRSWRRADWDAICVDLLQSDWSLVDGATDVNTCLQYFMAIWNSVIDRHCPARRVRVSRPHCPWIEDDPDLRALLCEWDCARDTWLCLRTLDAKADFIRLRNQVKSRLIKARRDFLCGEMTSGDSRGFWPVFKQFGMVTTRPSGNQSASPEESAVAADRLNRHFASVGPQIAADLRDAVTDGNRNPRPPTVCAAGFSFQPATLPELSLCIKRMKASRSVGDTAHGSS